MTKLVFKILLLIGLLLVSQVVITVFAFNPNTPKYVYLSAKLLKERRLMTTPAPRLILVGGSGVNLGFDSPRIERAIKMPVVNMGLQAGLGLRFNLNEIRDELKPGDVVVIVSEYEHYNSLVDGEASLLSVIFYNPSALRFITSPSQILVLAESWFNVSQEMVKARLADLFVPNKERSAPTLGKTYDAEGDYTGHLKQPSPGIAKFALGVKSDVNPEAIQVLDDFEQLAANKGARVYILFPAIPQELYQQNRNAIYSLCNALTAQTKIPILDAAQNYAFPRDYFFDTIYHLNAQGRAVRTDKFIAALKAQWSGAPLTPCHN